MSAAACEGSIQEGFAAVKGTTPALPAGFPPLGSSSWHREEAILPCVRPVKGHDPLPAALPCAFLLWLILVNFMPGAQSESEPQTIRLSFASWNFYCYCSVL